MVLKQTAAAEEEAPLFMVSAVLEVMNYRTAMHQRQDAMGPGVEVVVQITAQAVKLVAQGLVVVFWLNGLRLHKETRNGKHTRFNR